MISRKIFHVELLSFLFLLSAWVSILLQTTLPPYHTQIVALVSFLLGMISLLASAITSRQEQYEKKVSKVVISTVFYLAAGFGIFSMQAIPYDYTVAQSKTEQLQAAAQLGFQVAQQVASGNQTLPSATENISTLLPPNLTPIAQNSLTHTLIDNISTPQQATQQTVPTVSVKYLEWSCNHLGCAYGTDTHVWTVSWKSRGEGTVLFLISLILIYLSNSNKKAE